MLNCIYIPPCLPKHRDDPRRDDHISKETETWHDREWLRLRRGLQSNSRKDKGPGWGEGKTRDSSDVDLPFKATFEGR